MAQGQGVLGLNQENMKKIFCFRTTWLWCVIFGFEHCIVELFLVCSDGDLRAQKSSDALSFWFELLTQVSDLGPSWSSYNYSKSLPYFFL